jgi:hypothetical protein
MLWKTPIPVARITADGTYGCLRCGAFWYYASEDTRLKAQAKSEEHKKVCR